MNRQFLFNLLKLFAFLLALVLAYVGYSYYIERRAESLAHQFCSSLAAGMDLAQAKSQAEQAKADMIDQDADHFYISWTGIPPFSRHVCHIISDGNKIVSSDYFHED